MSYREHTPPRNGPTFDLRYDPQELVRAEQYVGKDGTLSFRVIFAANPADPPEYEAWMHDEVTPGGLKMLGAAAAVSYVAPAIPVPRFSIERGVEPDDHEVRAWFEAPVTHLMELNPRVCLMRYRPSRNMSATGRKKKGAKRWVHPSHGNGASATAGGSFNGGAHTYANGSLLAPRRTEWVLPPFTLFDDFPLAGLSFTTWFTTNVTTNGVFRTPIGDSATQRINNSRSQSFAFVLEVDNVDPSTMARRPRIRSAISEHITARWNSGINELALVIGERIPTARRLTP